MSQYPPEDPNQQPNQQPNYPPAGNQSGDYGQYPSQPSYPPYVDPNQPAQQGYPPYPDPSYQQPPYGQPSIPPTQYAPQVPPPYGQPPIAPQQPYNPQQPYAPPYNPQQPYAPPPKKSNRTLWIVLGVIAAVIVLSCGGVILAVSLAAKSAGNTLINASATIEAQTNATLTAEPTFAPINTPVPTATDSGASSGASPVPGGPHLVVGKTATVGQWQATVNSATSNPGDGNFNVPKSGDTFLLVDVTVKNNTSSTQPVSSLLMFTLQDSSGHSYDESFDNVSTPPPDANIASGATLHGVITYDVPLSMHNYVFTYQPDLIDQSSASWDVTI